MKLQVQFKAIYRLEDLKLMSPMHVIQLYSYEGQSYEIQTETRRRLLNDIINTPIPKDIVKFANKLFGLA